MNTKEASRKWNCTSRVVSQYCASGVIPLVEKDDRGRWIIPNDCKWPPCTLFVYVI